MSAIISPSLVYPNQSRSLVIGLFGLVGMGGVATSPLLGRLVDRMVPWYATLIATSAQVISYALQTAAAGLNVSVVIIVCFGIDSFRQFQQVSLTTSVFGLDPSARARMNAVLIISVSILACNAGSRLLLTSCVRSS